MGWAGHVARMGRREVYTGFWWGDLRKGYHLEEPGVDRRIILKWIFKKFNGGACTELICLRIQTGGGSCKCGNEPSRFRMCQNFLTS